MANMLHVDMDLGEEVVNMSWHSYNILADVLGVDFEWGDALHKKTLPRHMLGLPRSKPRQQRGHEDRSVSGRGIRRSMLAGVTRNGCLGVLGES
jgi:hypothetical protein